MSMNVQPTNAPSSYSSENQQSDSGGGLGQAKSTNDLNLINSVRALNSAEMKGAKVTVGDVQVIRNIEHALNVIKGPDTSFHVSVHKPTNTITIKVMNKETGEVIREIPPEKTLDLVAKFMEINGILIDERV